MTLKTKVWAGLLALMLAATWMAAAYAQGPGAEPAGPAPRTITLELKDADVRSALNMLFRESGFSYVLTPGVQGRVNVNLRDVSWDRALRFVLDSLNLIYRREDTVYYIERRGAALGPTPPTVPEPPRPAAGARGTTAVGGERLEIIKVLHSDPAMVAALFGGQSIGYLYGGMAGGMGQYGIGGYGYGGRGGYGGGYGGYGGYGGQGGYGGYGGQGGYGGFGGGLGGFGGGLGGFGGGLGGFGRSGYGGGFTGGYGGGYNPQQWAPGRRWGE